VRPFSSVRMRRALCGLVSYGEGGLLWSLHGMEAQSCNARVSSPQLVTLAKTCAFTARPAGCTNGPALLFTLPPYDITTQRSKLVSTFLETTTSPHLTSLFTRMISSASLDTATSIHPAAPRLIANMTDMAMPDARLIEMHPWDAQQHEDALAHLERLQEMVCTSSTGRNEKPDTH